MDVASLRLGELITEGASYGQALFGDSIRQRREGCRKLDSVDRVEVQDVLARGSFEGDVFEVAVLGDLELDEQIAFDTTLSGFSWIGPVGSDLVSDLLEVGRVA